MFLKDLIQDVVHLLKRLLGTINELITVSNQSALLLQQYCFLNKRLVWWHVYFFNTTKYASLSINPSFYQANTDMGLMVKEREKNKRSDIIQI